MLGEIPFLGSSLILLDANKCLQLICANFVSRAQARMVKLVEVEVGASNLVKVLPEMEDFDMNMTSDLELTKQKNLCKLGNHVVEGGLGAIFYLGWTDWTVD